jgi:sugar phosphate isomerase/epimerase
MYKYPGDEFFWRDQSGDYICTDLGDGAIPYHGLFNQLVEHKYTGYITLEPHVPVAQLKGTFKRSLNYLTKKLIV